MAQGTSGACSGIIGDNPHALISSRRVEGTPVFGRGAKRLGSIHSVMIDKVSGQAVYAVLSFGGFFGIWSHVYPVPWEKLSYSDTHGGYHIDLARQEIESAPSLRLDEADRITDQPYEERQFDYYRAPHYWLH